MNHEDEQHDSAEQSNINKHDARVIADSRIEAAQLAFEAQARGEAVDHVPMNTDIRESAEVVREQAGDSAPMTQQATAQQDDEEEQAVRAQLQDDATPSDAVMLREVKSAIRHEIDSVKSEVKQLQKAPANNAYELSHAIDLLRRLRDLLADLAHRSAEYVHQLWIEITQGKSIRETLA